MAEQASLAAGDNGDLELQERKSGFSGKKLVLFVVLPLVLLSGGGAAAYFLGALDSLLGKDSQEQAAAAMADPSLGAAAGSSLFLDLPEMLVNLNAGGRKTHYLKISVSLEVSSEADMLQVQRVMPRIVDSFQVYLRELRIEDLHGSAGLQRLREELLMRVNAAAKPAKIHDVLFKEMLVQ